MASGQLYPPLSGTINPMHMGHDAKYDPAVGIEASDCYAPSSTSVCPPLYAARLRGKAALLGKLPCSMQRQTHMVAVRIQRLLRDSISIIHSREPTVDSVCTRLCSGPSCVDIIREPIGAIATLVVHDERPRKAEK